MERITPETDELCSLNLERLTDLCAQETELFFRHQPTDARYCYELFRRAVFDREERAWELVYRQHLPLVQAWIHRHPSFSSTGEENQYFVNRAFEKMWVAVTPAKFEQFPDLKSLLRYLQICVHSVIIDYARQKDVSHLELEQISLQAKQQTALGVEARVVERARRREVWREVHGRLNSDKEQTVLYGSFVLGLKPRDLFARYTAEFDSIDEVYRVKENLLARLRRDAELQDTLMDLAGE